MLLAYTTFHWEQRIIFVFLHIYLLNRRLDYTIPMSYFCQPYLFHSDRFLNQTVFIYNFHLDKKRYPQQHTTFSIRLVVGSRQRRSRQGIQSEYQVVLCGGGGGGGEWEILLLL